MKIGELARRTGVNLETIRYYERRGLLPQPPRSSSGYRRFGEDDIQRVGFVKRAQELGFSLREIEELLTLRVAPGVTCDNVRQRAEIKLLDIERKIDDLLAIKKALKRLVSTCAGTGPVTACPILEAFDKNERFHIDVNR